MSHYQYLIIGGGMTADSAAQAIHEARKCFKKIRAGLRLVRDEIGEREQ